MRIRIMENYIVPGHALIIERIRSDMRKNKNTIVNGIGFSGLLTITFIVLKLTGVISWSWLWVLSPLWISTLASIVLITIVAVIYYFFNKS